MYRIAVVMNASLDRQADGPPCAGSMFAQLHFLGCVADRLDDVLVAGAAAKVASQCPTDFGFGRGGGVMQQLGRGHDHSPRAIAALQSVRLPESFLDPMGLAPRPRAARPAPQSW